MDSAGSTVQGIEVDENGKIYAYADPRKAGGVSGFWKSEFFLMYWLYRM